MFVTTYRAISTVSLLSIESFVSSRASNGISLIRSATKVFAENSRKRRRSDRKREGGGVPTIGGWAKDCSRRCSSGKERNREAIIVLPAANLIEPSRMNSGVTRIRICLDCLLFISRRSFFVPLSTTVVRAASSRFLTSRWWNFWSKTRVVGYRARNLAVFSRCYASWNKFHY